MSISMNSIFSSGWEDIKKNPILFVPNILLFIFSTILLFAIGIVFFIFFSDSLDVLINSSSEFLVNSDFDLLMNSWSDFFWAFLPVGIIYVFIYILLTAYVQAGLIGMSYDVAKTGDTQFSRMFFYGNKYLFRSLFASILVSLIILLPLFLFALLFGIGFLLPSDVFLLLFIFLAVLMFPFFLFYLIYLIIFSLYLYFVLYAVVIDDLSAIAGIRKSIALFKANIGDVIIFWLIIMAISIAVGMIASLFSYLGIIPVIGFIFSILYFLLQIFISIFLTAIVTVWGTRMYLELTEKTDGCNDCINSDESNKMSF